LVPREKHPYPFNRRLGVPQSRRGPLGEEKTLLLLPGIKPLPYYSVVEIPNEAALVVRRGYGRMFERDT